MYQLNTDATSIYTFLIVIAAMVDAVNRIKYLAWTCAFKVSNALDEVKENGSQTCVE